jgi:hypothetical protein
VNVPEMTGDNAETYQGYEAGFRLHVSATYAAIKVRRRQHTVQTACTLHSRTDPTLLRPLRTSLCECSARCTAAPAVTVGG